MAGFAAAIGGVERPALEYGQQIRGILEQRRSHFADLMTQLAAQEPDPQRRAAYLSHASDLLSGKDMTKVIPAAVKDLQDHAQSNTALAEAFGGPPSQPKQIPSPAGPGQTPGTATAPAAQPATSPVQPSQQPSFNPTDLTRGLTPIVPQQSPAAAAPTPTPAIQPVGAAQAPPLIPGLPPGSPQPKGAQAILAEYEARPEWKTPAGRAALLPFMQAEVTHDQALQQTLEAQNVSLAYRRQAYEQLKQSPSFQQLPPYIKAAYEAQLGGLTPVQLPGMAMMPRLLSTGTLGKDAPPETLEYGTNKPVSSTTRYRVMEIPSTGERIWQPEEAQTTITPTAGGAQVSNRQTGETIAPVAGAVPAAMNAPKTLPTAGGGVGMITPAQVQAGGTPTPIPRAVTPSLLPTTTNELRSITTTDANGNPATLLQPVSTTRTRGGATPAVGGTVPPVAGAPRGSGQTFEKPFTPEQILHGQQQLGQYNLAIDRISNIQKQLPLLNSMIESGKLNLELDSSGLVRAIINRALPMTAAESQFVGNFRTMMEDINLLRGPMGSTGFRGPEAWAALQAQRGQLLANPEITKQVLTNTLTALKAQQQPLQQRFAPKTTPANGGKEDLTKLSTDELMKRLTGK